MKDNFGQKSVESSSKLKKSIIKNFNAISYIISNNDTVDLNLFPKIEAHIFGEKGEKMNYSRIGYFIYLILYKRNIIHILNNPFGELNLNKTITHKTEFYKLLGLLLFKKIADYEITFLLSDKRLNLALEEKGGYTNVLNFFDEPFKVCVDDHLKKKRTVKNDKNKKQFYYNNFDKHLNQIHNRLKKQLAENMNFFSAIKLIPKKFYLDNELENIFPEDYFSNIYNQADESIKMTNPYLQELGIGRNIDVERNNNYGINELHLIDLNGKSNNLFFQGHGISQISIVAELYKHWSYKKTGSKLVFIEEPEISLHPALQSKLADFFRKAYNQFNIQTIMETHSEYLIRKFQILVKRGELKPEDIIIYYLNPNNDNEKIFPIHILENGLLDKDFGKGFFDESDDLAFELFNLNSLN